jgi:hypothetical protein
VVLCVVLVVRLGMRRLRERLVVAVLLLVPTVFLLRFSFSSAPPPHPVTLVASAAPTAVPPPLQVALPPTRHLPRPLRPHADPLMQLLRSRARDSAPGVEAVNDQSLSLSQALAQLNDVARASFGFPAGRDKPDPASDRIVLVIMTHSRTGYVERLLQSLARVEGISETEVIVSTDGYNKDLPAVLAKFGACPIRQVFFPASPHLFPAMHPGSDPRDCPRNAPVKDQEQSGCRGVADRFHHYRETKFVALKLHWAWLWNWLFSAYLPSDFRGNVILMEDDAVITSSAFYRNAKLLFAQLPKQCPACRGTSFTNPSSAGKKTIVFSGANKVYGYTREGWEDIVKHHKQYCSYGDYNWDQSADYLPTDKYGMLTIGISQATVMGSCGLHGPEYDSEKCKEQVSLESLIANSDHSLIDATWDMAEGQEVKHHERAPLGGGGWGDPRDVELCNVIFGASQFK